MNTEGFLDRLPSGYDFAINLETFLEYWGPMGEAKTFFGKLNPPKLAYFYFHLLPLSGTIF
jgi:hypothetical protein